MPVVAVAVMSVRPQLLPVARRGPPRRWTRHGEHPAVGDGHAEGTDVEPGRLGPPLHVAGPGVEGHHLPGAALDVDVPRR